MAESELGEGRRNIMAFPARVPTPQYGEFTAALVRLIRAGNWSTFLHKFLPISSESLPR